MKTIFIILCFSFLSYSKILSQIYLEADAGVGLFEAASIKLKYGRNIQVGIAQGFFDRSPWLTGVEVYYHFLDLGKYTEQKPFYLMAGLSSTTFAKAYDLFEKVIFYPRFGRTFNFSENTGINLDTGLALIISEDGIGGYNVVPFPTISAHFFIRI